MFLHIFWNIRRKKNRNILFFKIFRQNHRPLFFRKFFQGFLNFSKTTRYIFLIVFGPLRRVIKTSFEKKIKKKNRFFFCQKISHVFFLRIFTRISQISRKLLTTFSWLFLSLWRVRTTSFGKIIDFFFVKKFRKFFFFDGILEDFFNLSDFAENWVIYSSR